jgi:hypothetical protein
MHLPTRVTYLLNTGISENTCNARTISVRVAAVSLGIALVLVVVAVEEDGGLDVVVELLVPGRHWK